jgi:apurinic endonuclease APN1
MKTLWIGSQAPDEQKDSLFQSIQKVLKNKGNVVQIFLRDMTTTSSKGRKIIPEQEQQQIKKYIKQKKIKVFVHGSYLLHFCTVPEGLVRIQWAYELLAQDMILAKQMGISGTVIHMCSRRAVDQKRKPLMLSEKETEKRMVNHISYYLKKYDHFFPNVQLILENSASEGLKIGGKMESFGNVFRPLRRKFGKKIGVCLDTCHAFSSGYDLSSVSGTKFFLDEFKKYVGEYSVISLIHLNDSALPLGSKKDRHAPLGKGHIYHKNKNESLLYLLCFAYNNEIPMCLETHGNYKKEISFLHLLMKRRELCHKRTQELCECKRTQELCECKRTQELCECKGTQELCECKRTQETNGQLGGKRKKKVKKKEILDILKCFYEYHKSLGNKWEALQYEKAISSLKESPIKMIYSGKELLALPFIGKGIVQKVEEYLQTGKVKLLEEFKKNPKIKAYTELTKIFGVGFKHAKKMVDSGIFSVKDLKQSNYPLTESQKKGLKYYDDLIKKIPRKESEKIKKIIEKELKTMYGKDAKVYLAGSYRLGKKESGDIDLLLVVEKVEKNFLKNFIKKLYEKEILFDSLQGEKEPKINQRTYVGLAKVKGVVRHIDFHLVPKKQLPFHMLYFGSGESFSRTIRKIAKEKGYKLNDKGLFKGSKRISITNKKPFNTEKNIFDFLQISWVSPKKR